jgi:hypothetical protein
MADEKPPQPMSAGDRALRAAVRGQRYPSPHALAAMAFTVLPTVFMLGCFTVVRLIDASVANIISLRRMGLIRRYYASIAPWAAPLAGTLAASAPLPLATALGIIAGRALLALGLRYEHRRLTPVVIGPLQRES